MPLLTYLFDDQEILKEVYTILITYTHYFGNNSAEKEKVKNTLHILMKSYFELDYEQWDIDETLDHENQIILGVGEIEQKLYDKIYSYMVQQLYVKIMEELK